MRSDFKYMLLDSWDNSREEIFPNPHIILAGVAPGIYFSARDYHSCAPQVIHQAIHQAIHGPAERTEVVQQQGDHQIWG